MPVESDSGGIDADDLEEERSHQGVGKTLGLLGSVDGPVGSAMQSTNGKGSGGGGREGQLLHDDVVSAERNDKEYTKEASSSGESN